MGHVSALSSHVMVQRKFITVSFHSLKVIPTAFTMSTDNLYHILSVREILEVIGQEYDIPWQWQRSRSNLLHTIPTMPLVIQEQIRHAAIMKRSRIHEDQERQSS